MDVRKPERLRERPPACSLPTARDVALACALKDHVTSPDYRPPTYDEEGVATDPQHVPTYAASGLRCRFASRDRNLADCSFRLTLPGGATIRAGATFEHRFVQDHGPAHHLYGVSWFANDRCVPASMSLEGS